MYLGSWKIDDLVTFYANTTRFDTGNATDADAVPAYRIYEDETGTAILTGNMALLDSANTAGFYSEQITLSAANGFEKGKSYAIYIAATVNSVAGATHHTLQIEAEVDANTVSPVVSANVTQLGGVAQSLTDLKDFADDGYDPATNKVQGVVLTDTLTTYTGNTPQTGDSFTRLGAPAGASVSADIVVIDNFVDDLESRLTATRAGYLDNLSAGAAALEATAQSIKAKTDQLTFTIANKVDSSIQAAGDFAQAAADKVWSTAARILTAGTNIVLAKGTGVTGFNDLSAAQVNTEVDTALADARLDELLTADSDIDGAAPPTVGSVFHELLTKTAGSFTYDQATDSLEALRDRGDAAWITGTTPPTAAAVADAVWDETLADHLTAGSTGNALNAAGSAGDPWSTVLPGAYGATTAGKIVGDNLNATVSSRSSHSAADVWAVVARTITGGTITTNSDKTGYALSVAGIQAIWDALTSALTTVGSIGKLLVDNLNATVSSRSSHSAADVWASVTRTLTAGTNIVLAKGVGVTGFNDLSSAQVNTEVVDALNVDTYTQPGQEAPAATTTLANMIKYLYKALRNRKTQTLAGQMSLYADDAVTVDQKATILDDAVTYDHGELVSGP